MVGVFAPDLEVHRDALGVEDGGEPLMAIASEKTSGCRQTDATALKAPIEAPATTISTSGDWQSVRMAGTISW